MSEYIIDASGQLVLHQDQPQQKPVEPQRPLNTFDFINCINKSYDDMFARDPYTLTRTNHSDSVYVKYLINRQFSYYPDTIMYANVANVAFGGVSIPNYAHFDFYRFIVPKAKRFAKWGKKYNDDDIQAIVKYYNVSITKAIQIVKVLTQQQIQQIKHKLDHGGIKK